MQVLKKIIFQLGFALIGFSQFAYATVYNHVAVANRNAGTISLIGLKEDTPDLRIDLQSVTADFEYNQFNLGFEIEPMYLSKFRASDPMGGILEFLAVGDRKNSQILMLKPMGGSLLNQIQIGRGAFHSTTRLNELYVATDTDKGFNYVRAFFNHSSSGRGFQFVNNRFDLPQQFLSGTPHDIIGSDNYIYLSVHNVVEGPQSLDVLLQVDKNSLEVMKVRKFAAEIHLYDLGDRFLVLEQQTGLIRVVDSQTFADLSLTQGPVGVHGVNAIDAQRATYVFVTDIDQSKGDHAVLTYRLDKNHQMTLTTQTSTSVGTAHNIAVLGRGVFVTHSGPQSSAVSLLEFNEASESLELVRLIHTGFNPFGITGLTF